MHSHIAPTFVIALLLPACGDSSTPASDGSTGTTDASTDPESGGSTLAESTGAASDGPPDSSGGDTTSTPSTCGDGIVDPGETCDDGINDGSYDGCSADCTALGPYCGDGELNGDEVCDDGTNDGSYGGCDPGCLKLAVYCGDGTLSRGFGESCDDGNDAINDTCNPDCTLPGEVIWESTWASMPEEELPENYYIVSAGLAQLPDGSVHVVVYDQGDGIPKGSKYETYSAWNLVVDHGTGEITEALHVGDHFQVLEVVRYGDGVAFSATIGGVTTIALTGPDGQVQDEILAPDVDYWSSMASDHEADVITALAGTFGDLVRRYDDGSPTFDYENAYVSLRKVAVASGNVFVAARNNIMDALTVFRLDASGGIFNSVNWPEGDGSPDFMTGLSDGGVLVLGRSLDLGDYVARFDAEPSHDWTHSAGLDGSFHWRHACESSNGDIFATGEGGGQSDPVLLTKLAPDGSLIWERTFDPFDPDGEIIRPRFACDQTGGVVMTFNSFEILDSDPAGRLRILRVAP